MRQPVTQPHFNECHPRLLFSLLARHSPDQQRHRHIFQRREFSQQMMKLVDESDMTITPHSSCCLIDSHQILAHYLHRTVAGFVQTPEEVEQGALSGTGSTDHGHSLTCGQVDIDTAEYRHCRRPLTIDLLQTACVKHHFALITHSVAPRPD